MTQQNDTANAARLEAVRVGYARGWSFTPLNGKVPVLSGWQSAPRESLEQALEWAAQGNVGLRCGQPSGVLVVDVDPGGKLPNGWPTETVTVETPRGCHYYYQAPEGVPVGNSAGKLAAHVDVRGFGGQVVFVGSTHPETGAIYRWAPDRSPEDFDLAPWPVELYERLTRKPERPAAMAGSVTMPPIVLSDGYLSKALNEELALVASAPEGQRNATLNTVAYKLAGYQWPDSESVKGALLSAAIAAGLPSGEAAKSLASGWAAGEAAPRTVTPRTARGGVSYSWDSVIPWFPALDAPMPGMEETENETTGTEAATGAASWLEVLPDDWFDVAPPARDWVLGEAFPAGAVSFIVGAPGGGKSYLALEYMASVATGLELIPERKPTRMGETIYVSLEDDRHEVRRRLRKVCMAFDVAPHRRDWLKDSFALVTHPLFESCVFRPDGGLAAGPHLEMLRKAIEERQARFVVVDTFARTLGARLDENANSAMGAVSALYASIVPDYCSLAVIAHPPKNSESGTVRGGGSIDGAMRYREFLRPATDKETAGVDSEAPVWAVEVVKSNYGPVSTLFLEKQGGEFGGVLVPSDATERAARQRSNEASEAQRILCEELAAHDLRLGELTGKRDEDGLGKEARGRLADKGLSVSTRTVEALVKKLQTSGALTLVERDGKTLLKPRNWATFGGQK